jgi:hypothetical protein
MAPSGQVRLNALLVVFCVSLYPGNRLFAATVADILGTRNALQCYMSGLDIRCRDLLTGDDWKVTERVKPAKQHWTGSINADGAKLVFEDDRWVCVINLDRSDRHYVAGPRMTNGHFWRDQSGNDWVVYSGEEESFRQAGTTWKVQIDAVTNEAIDSSRTLMLGEQYTCGLSNSGTYLGDVFTHAYLYTMSTAKKSTVLYDTTSWWEPKCYYGSVHPGDKPQLMFSIDRGLHTIVIAQWQETTNTRRFIWQYSYPSGAAWALWSSTDPAIASLVKDRRLYLLSITPDMSGSANTTGSYTEAATGLSFASDTALVGRPWVGTRPNIAGTPLINPPGGVYARDTVSVSISCVTDSVQIYYTLDGTDPTTSSMLYSAAFPVAIPDTGRIVLTAQAVKAGMSASPVASAPFSRLALNAATTLSADMESGLRYAYYEGYFLSPTDVYQSWAQPATRGDADSFSLSMRECEEQFAIRFSGYFNAPEDGKYTFHVISDDSSRLLIDSVLVAASNYKLSEVSGSIGLKAGAHPVELAYHQGDGGKKLYVRYEGPGISKTILGSNRLSREKKAITVTSPNAFDTVLVGASLPIQWRAAASVTSIHIDISADKRATWSSLTTAAIGTQDAHWANYSWKIPQKLSSQNLHNSRIIVRVRSAADSSAADESDHRIHISDPSSVRLSPQKRAPGFSIRNYRGASVITVPFAGRHTLTLLLPDGRVVARYQRQGAQSYTLDATAMPAGIYLVRLVAEKAVINRCAAIIR